MHSPKKMLQLLGKKSEYGALPKIERKGLRDCQYNSEVNLEASLKAGKKKALAILATGSGKTYLACLAAYRLLNLSNGDQDVVNELNKWGSDAWHKVDFIDMSEVASGSVANGNDCRICDLKAEFNRQINASSAVIFVVGDMTGLRTAGSGCERAFKDQGQCICTPYKQNTNGIKACKIVSTSTPGENDDCGNINRYSYLRHEFEQAKKRNKTIIIVYNSMRKETSWLPSYMEGYEDCAKPFWKYDSYGRKVGDYAYIKEVLGF